MKRFGRNQKRIMRNRISELEGPWMRQKPDDLDIEPILYDVITTIEEDSPHSIRTREIRIDGAIFNKDHLCMLIKAVQNDEVIVFRELRYIITNICVCETPMGEISYDINLSAFLEG